jgi:hypothetical protein
MRTDHGDIGFPAPASTSTFRPCPAVSLRPPSTRDFRLGFHPPTSFSPPPEFYGLRPASCTRRNLAASPTPEGASLGVSVPHRGINQRRPPLPGDPTPSSSSVLDVSHVLDGLLRHQPCGFVSPRCHVQGLPFRGLSLTTEPYRVSPADSCPRAVERNQVRFDPRPTPPSTSGPCSPRRVRCRPKPFKPRPIRAPLGLHLLRVLFPCTVGTPSRPLRPRPWPR